ncbi:unnamed protein product [Prorocentrum cordatum]|uniref:Uncharacterized protein n=1 Tax=Prorocentrum cordatum TaxID=2364126 RepID=A0ABN9WA87_9DINO|nr:unnamed protein product [Polarella glacialis]
MPDGPGRAPPCCLCITPGGAAGTSFCLTSPSLLDLPVPLGPKAWVASRPPTDRYTADGAGRPTAPRGGHVANGPRAVSARGLAHVQLAAVAASEDEDVGSKAKEDKDTLEDKQDKEDKAACASSA